ncbi:hypothetical protein FIBSPDRAFT_860221 [Athelia psychrophila]|uniref:F-box domain-containing protein n=1 Tax=Athelia psychrophila TaxID=1759441 RepID=A0A166KEM2_9AGAM|nr:hypothetical protein FIBSPDRAFT_860221 [Fibularhizoctonia sp. CBS 109695]
MIAVPFEQNRLCRKFATYGVRLRSTRLPYGLSLSRPPIYTRQQHIIQLISSCEAPRLELLNIIAREPSAPSGHPLPIFSGGTPLLTHLALNRRASNLYLPSLQSVTTLALGITCSRELEVIPVRLGKSLQEMPLLVHLRLSDVDWWPTAHPLILPHLRTLYLDAHYYDVIMNVFIISIYAPVLEELTAAALDYTGGRGEGPYWLRRNESILAIEGDGHPFLSLRCLRSMSAFNQYSMFLCCFPGLTAIHTAEVAPTDFSVDERHLDAPFAWSNIFRRRAYTRVWTADAQRSVKYEKKLTNRSLPLAPDQGILTLKC